MTAANQSSPSVQNDPANRLPNAVRPYSDNPDFAPRSTEGKVAGSGALNADAGAPMTTIAIVEDNAGLGASLRRIVQSTPDCQCVGVWKSGEEALKKVPAFRPNVVLMDIHMPGISGIETTARLKAEMPELLVIMVTVYADHDKIFDALKAGACGYLLKCSSPEEVRQAIIDVRKGGAPMSPEIARRVVEAFHRPAPKEEDSLKLSPRETELLEHLSEGLGNKEIADRMTLSVETVRTYLKHIYDKLHVRSRTEAALKYKATSGGGLPR